jgi:hypothetical protein
MDVKLPGLEVVVVAVMAAIGALVGGRDER